MAALAGRRSNSQEEEKKKYVFNSSQQLLLQEEEEEIEAWRRRKRSRCPKLRCSSIARCDCSIAEALQHSEVCRDESFRDVCK